MFLLDDGIQSPVTFATNKKSLVVATFARFLLRNIGKSGYARGHFTNIFVYILGFILFNTGNKRPMYLCSICLVYVQSNALICI